MSKRITELMAQAGFDPAQIERMGVMPQAVKFAELIVMDCARVAEYNTPDTEECEYTQLASRMIQKRFGLSD